MGASEDFACYDRGCCLMGSGSTLYIWPDYLYWTLRKPFDHKWEPALDLSPYGIKDFYGIAFSFDDNDYEDYDHPVFYLALVTSTGKKPLIASYSYPQWER